MEQTSGQPERRSLPRFSINQLIGYFPNREEYLWAEGVNLSLGGVQCASREPIDPLTNVFMMLNIPTSEGERLVRCEGSVTYSRMENERCIFGVRFEDIAAEDRKLLEKYLASLKEEE
jgi:c-di-GMP-binding flagellar brake protein YcgR